MPAILRISPAATGKTTALVHEARVLATNLATQVRVVVPAYPQVRAWRRMLAESGGAIGIDIFTFPQLYQQVLDAAGRPYTRLSAPVQFRLLQSILHKIPLDHYAILREKPGFIHAVLREIAELKAGSIWPDAFAESVCSLGAEPRLMELARIYTAYQNHLQENNWVDKAGMGWLAAEKLEADTSICRDWSVLYVDGFDDLTPVQINVLKQIAQRVPDVVVTLTGDRDVTDRLVHRRYDRTRDRLVKGIDNLVIEKGVISKKPFRIPALNYIESTLLTENRTQTTTKDGIDMIAAPNQELEVRAAMRWLKQRVVTEGICVSKLGLLCRSVASYKQYIEQTATEYGIPIHLLHDEPLTQNPCIAALMNLLSCHAEDFPRQKTIDTWFSPYFNWSLALGLDTTTYSRINESRKLNAVALWGKVIGGANQWITSLRELAEFDAEDRQTYDAELSSIDAPVGEAAQAMLDQLNLFINFLQPPDEACTYREFVYWLENMIGDFTEESSISDSDILESVPSLCVLDNIYAGPLELKQRDQAALQAFKEVLRGFVWAEEVIERDKIDFDMFLTDLMGAVQGAIFQLPFPTDREAVLIADVIQVRGINFDAVAVMGLAEGEFPGTSREDPFLPDSDRRALGDQYGLQLNISTESHEVGYFYDAITRSSKRLLLTRPRLTDSGAAWQPSPFWLEIQRLTDIQPEDLVSDSVPSIHQLASQTEGLYYSSVVNNVDFTDWLNTTLPSRWTAINHASRILLARVTPTSEVNQYAGNLTRFHDHFSERYGPGYIWSASRLESYGTCPLMFFMSSVLNMQPRDEPELGFDARQLGNIYHHIFESVYETAEDPTDLDELLQLLPSISERILDEAPSKERFRVTSWWMHSREEIVENVRNSLQALQLTEGNYAPYAYEQSFGLHNLPPLVVHKDDDYFQVRGYIDRVDKGSDGTIRIIDYKTSGPSEFTAAAVRRGKKLQLPLYALAARDALGLGNPGDGFYWHVRDAQPSSFTLKKFGSESAIRQSVSAAWRIIHAIRNGEFSPKPPRTGCPRYCPAVEICWQYQPGFSRT